GNELHDDVARVLADAGVVDLGDVRVLHLARERCLGEEQLPEQAPAHRVAQRLREDALHRDLAVAERVLAEEHLRGRALAELAHDRVVRDVVHQSLFAACATARRTSWGAVPPGWLRAATDPSGVSTRFTSAPILGEKRRRVASGSRARSVPARSASRTARATASCASRNGTPLRTR